MKKFLFSLIMLAGISISQAQWQTLSTNIIIGTTAVSGQFSNNTTLISPSNSTWIVDELVIDAVPENGSTSPFYVSLYDTWYPTNRYHGGSTVPTNFLVTNVIQYMTNLPMNIGSNSTQYSEGVYVTTSGVTNYITNYTMFTLSTTVPYHNFSNTLAPVFTCVAAPSVKSTYTGLGLTFGKGVLLNSRVYPGVVCSNNITYTIKYKELFSPTRP